MSSYQWKKYSQARTAEMEKEKASRFSKSDVVRIDNKLPFRNTQASYRVYTRTISNFVFPPNITRPRRGSMTNQQYNEKMNEAISKLSKKDLTTSLGIYSPKMKEMMKKIIKSKKQKIFIYSEFLTLEGIGIFTKILEAFGFVNFTKDADNKDYKKYRRFAVWSGSVDADEEINKENFNSKKNLRGKSIKFFWLLRQVQKVSVRRQTGAYNGTIFEYDRMIK